MDGPTDGRTYLLQDMRGRSLVRADFNVKLNSFGGFLKIPIEGTGSSSLKQAEEQGLARSSYTSCLLEEITIERLRIETMNKLGISIVE